MGPGGGAWYDGSMKRFVAFLRGMNLGRRRVTNDELCAHVRDLGFHDVSAFLASGNVLFGSARGTVAQLTARLEEGLETALAYAVPVFVRTAGEVVAIAEFQPFDEDVGPEGGKLQVAMLRRRPLAAAVTKVLAFATAADPLEIEGRELYWLPRGKITESELDLKAIGRVLGPLTMRTRRTLERIAARLSAT